MNLDEIEARANAATPVEEWECGMEESDSGECGEYSEYVRHFCAGPHCETEDAARKDAVFIAAARTDVPALIARVRELEEQLLTAEERLEQRTRERDHERATLAGVLACGGSTYSEGETLLRAQAAEAQQLARQMMDERDKLRAECAALRGEIAALMDDH